MNRGRPLPQEKLELVGQLLDDGWSFMEITRTHGIHYKALNKYFPGRAWTRQQVSEQGMLVRTLKIERAIRIVPAAH